MTTFPPFEVVMLPLKEKSLPVRTIASPAVSVFRFSTEQVSLETRLIVDAVIESALIDPSQSMDKLPNRSRSPASWLRVTSPMPADRVRSPGPSIGPKNVMF